MVRTILHTTNAITADFVQNQFAVETDALAIDDAGVVAAVKTFYDTLIALYPATIAQNGYDVKIYVMPGIEPNYPVFEGTFNLASAPSGAAGPSEIALCTSFQAVKTPGLPQSRRRGRMYIGPFDAAQIDEERPNSTIISALADATAALVDDINTLTDHAFSVYSSVTQTSAPVLDGWVDNAWDVQRRRGVVPSTRTTWTLA